MRREEAPQILGAVACVGERAFAASAEMRNGFLSGRKMAMRLNARWGGNLPAPVDDRRHHAAVFRRIKRDAVGIWRAFREEGKHEILGDGEVLDAIRDGPVIGPRLEVQLRIGEAVNRPNDSVTAFQQLFRGEFSLGIGHLTSTADLTAKVRRAEGKIPKKNVPSAGSTSAAFMPALKGSAALAASLGSCMYITTRMRR